MCTTIQYQPSEIDRTGDKTLVSIDCEYISMLSHTLLAQDHTEQCALWTICRTVTESERKRKKFD